MENKKMKAKKMRRRVTIFAVAITVLLLIALTMNSVSAESKAKVKLNPSDAAKVALNPSESMTFSTERALNELIYDDDTAENAYAWDSAGDGFAVRFTPLSYPVDILTARICFWPDWPDSNHEEFAVYVYDDDGLGGEPGTCLGGPIYHTATDWGWCDVDISGPGITIVSDDFYILYQQLTDDPDCEALCVDENLPQYGRSWDYEDGSWELWDVENYMIRCVVDVDGTTTEVSIENASAPQGGTVTVPINITGVANMCGANIWLNYNKDVVIVDSVSDGDLVPLTHSIDNTAGVTKITWDTTSGMTGDFVFAYVTLKAVGNQGDTSLLDIDVKELYDCNLVEIPRTVVDGTFTILPSECGNMTVNPTSWNTTLNCSESDNEVVTVSATGGTVEGVTVSKVFGPTWLSVSPTDLGDIASDSSKTFTMTASPPSETSGDFPYCVRVSNTCGNPSSREVTGTIHVTCIISETEVSIEDASAPQGGTVTVPINITGVENMCGANIWLNYNKDIVIVDSVSDGDLVPLTYNINNTAGVTKITWDTTSGETGDFVFADVTLKAVGNTGDTCLLDIDVKELYDCDLVEIPRTVVDGTFTILPSECGNMTVNPTSWNTTLNCSESDNEVVTVSATGGTVEGVTVSKVFGPTWLSVSPTDLGDIASDSSKTFTMTASPPSETSGDFPYCVRVSNTCGNPSSREVTGTIHVTCIISETEVSIEDASAPQGGTVTVPINITGVENMCGANIWLNYNKDIVIVDSVSDGDLVPLTYNINNTAGVTKITWDTTSGETGDFVFADVTLKAVGNTGDTCLLDIDVKELYDCDLVEIPRTVVDGTFTILPSECGNMTVNPTSWNTTLNCSESDNEVVTVSATGGTVEGVTVSKVFGPTWLSVSPTDLGDIASDSSKTFTMTASPPSETSGDFPYCVRVSNTCGNPSSREVTGTIHVTCIISETEVSIENASAPQGGTVTVPINITGVENMCGANIWLNYNKDIVIVDSVSDGDLVPLTYNINNTAGVTKMTWDTTSGETGDFVFADVTLKAVCNNGDTCLLDIDVKELYDCDLVEIPRTVVDGTFTCVDKPDLIATEITVNYDAPSLGGRAIGPERGPDVHTECNNLSAVIEENNEVDVESPFDVTFEVDGTTLCTVRVPSLTGGTTKTVYCNCSWYPYAGDDFAINVTVDSNHEIPESNETDNTKWNNGTVVSNGYKGDGWQGPYKNLIDEQCHDQDRINLTYSVGDSKYVSGSTHWTDYTGSWTTTDLPVPDGATIQKAMLYVYYTWDKDTVMPDNVNMAFNGNNIALARDYSDRKGFGSYDYPAGMLIYDVRSHFTATGPNNAILTKAVADDEVSMRGMLLMVVYYHPDEPERIICIDEGYDMLYAKESYAVTSEEATTYAPFTCCEPVPVEKLDKATLIAVAPSAKDGGDMNRLSFNDGLWNGIWDHYEAATELGIARADVLAYLKPAENRANFQSHIPAGGDKGDFMDASNAFLILEKRPPDLTVTEITVNYDASSLGGRAIGPEPGPDVHTECNNLSAVIEEENGVDVGSPFDVMFKVDGTTLCTVLVPGLTGGANKTVYCNCSWYPMAGDVFAIDVTADSNHEIPESNETNNTKWNNGTAVSNGYKGDGWQGPDKNLENVQCHDLDTINLIYSVGDSEYVSGSTLWTDYTGSWTTTDLPVPGGAEIQKAMLYVYYTWDKNDVMPDNVNMAFNGNNIALARDYSDRKGFGGYNYPSGMLIYDVVNHFTATGTNNAVLTKTAAADEVSMRGMLLMVVYKHPDEPERIIYIDEGYDMLYAKDSYAVSSEEATTYAPFTRCEPVPVEELVKATLIAVAPSAKDGDDMNRLSFNDGLWNGIWDHYEANTQLGIAVADVFAYLKAAENRANFQSHIPAGGDKGDFMDASNAFLILEKKGEIPCPAKYAVYQANVRDPEEPLNKLRALRDQKLEDGYVTSYYEHSPALTLVLSRADSDLVKDGAQLLSRYSIPVGLHVQGMDVNERITKQDVEEALSFTDRLKREVMKNRDAIGADSTEAIIDFIEEFEGQVKASEGKTFRAALKSSIYYEGGQLRVDQQIVEK